MKTTRSDTKKKSTGNKTELVLLLTASILLIGIVWVFVS